MSISDEDISTLNQLGLSITQAKIYLTLAYAKNLTAQETSKRSGAARPLTYRVLDDLLEKGLITKIIDKPARFHAISPVECVSTLMNKRAITTAELREKAKLLKLRLKNRAVSKAIDKPVQLEILPKRAAIYAKTEEILKNVQVSISFLSFTRRVIALFRYIAAPLEEALGRGVECRVIIPKTHTELWKTINTFEKYQNFTVKVIPILPKAGFSIWDKKELLIATSSVDSPTPPATIWSDNNCIVDLCQEYFEHLWEKSEKPIKITHKAISQNARHHNTA